MRPRLLLPTLATAALLIAGCGTSTTSHGTTSSTPTRAATTRSTPTRPGGTAHTARTTTATQHGSAGAAAATTAAAFAAAYARYLDGALPAAALPYATGTARAQAGPVIPPAQRAGALVVRSVQPLGGGQTFSAELRDRAHTFAVQLTAGRSGSRWLIVGMQPPDLDSILHAQTRPIPQPSGSQSAASAARAFMTGYLPWLYAEGPVSAIHAATAALIAQLKAHPPNVPPSLQGLHPRLAALGMKRHRPGWDALALVSDGHQTYDLTLTVLNEHGRWLVNTVTYPGG
jgi:hypothetical protein